MRKSLELCDVQKDVEHFINLRQTGDKPPGRKSLAVQDYSTQKVAMHSVRQLWVSVAVCHQCRFASLISSSPVWKLLQWSEDCNPDSALPNGSIIHEVKLLSRVCIYLSLFCYIFLTTQFLCVWFCRRAALPDPTNSSRSTYSFPNTRLWCAANMVLSLFFSAC